MSLVETFEYPGWRDRFRSSFEYALRVLKEDRFRSVGSAVDDLRAWLARGGVARVRQALAEQLEERRLPETLCAEVRDFLEEVVDAERPVILELMVSGIIPATGASFGEILGVDGDFIVEMVARIHAGERPFEDWMHAHGRSNEEIAAIYALVDRFLVEQKLLSSPPPPWKPRLRH